MQVTLEQLEPCKVAVSVEVDAEAVGQALDHVLREISKRVSVPGFRKGRAPRTILKQYIEPSYVHEQAVSELVNEYFEKALREKEIIPFAQAEVSHEELEAGKPFRFTATVPTGPVVRLCDYRDVPAKRRKVAVTDEEVDLRIELMRRREMKLEASDAEAATAGLMAVVDLDLYRGDRHLKNRSRQNTGIDMDDAEMVPAFNLAIEGKKVGEVAELPVHFPEDHRDPVLAGKDILFKITVKELKKKVIPELDDEFAKAAGFEGVETVDALRAKVREMLEQEAKDVADREVRDQVLQYVSERSEVHFPDVMLVNSVERTLNEQREELEKQGVQFEDYLKAQDTDLEAYKAQLREGAKQRLTNQFVLREVAEKEDIKATDEDLDKEIEAMAKHYGIPAPSMRAMLDKNQETLDNLRIQIVFNKALDLLVNSARVTEE